MIVMQVALYQCVRFRSWGKERETVIWETGVPVERLAPPTGNILKRPLLDPDSEVEAETGLRDSRFA